MKKIIAISVVFTIIFAGLALSANANKVDTNANKDVVYGRCLQPMKPFLPIKPLWCTGTWTQVLNCDTNCNCHWETVCLQ